MYIVCVCTRQKGKGGVSSGGGHGVEGGQETGAGAAGECQQLVAVVKGMWESPITPPFCKF